MHKYLRFSSFGDGELFNEFVSQYDFLIVNAHIASYYPKAVPKLLYRNDIRYIIDPRTFIFQMPPKELFDKKTRTSLSASYRKLFERYYDASVTEDFLRTQSGLSIHVVEQYYNEIYEGTISSQLQAFYGTIYERHLVPSFLFSPSFAFLKNYSDDESKKVLDLNIKSINDCIREYGNQYDIAAILIISKETLTNTNIRQKIIDSYSKLDIKSLFLWLDDFNGLKSETHILKDYKRLINGLNKHCIIDLYADYSSFILCSDGSPVTLKGVCVTAGYNESRSISGVMGGTPAAKYYMSDIHMRFLPADFIKILAAREYFDESVSESDRATRFLQEICDCIVCEETIGSDINNIREFMKVTPTRNGKQVSARDSLELAQRHFLYAKLKEADDIQKSTYAHLLRQLEDAFLDYASYGLTGLQGIGHWLNVFKR